MTLASLHDWSTPRAFRLPELGPGIDGTLQEALDQALRRIAAAPSLKALVAVWLARQRLRPARLRPGSAGGGARSAS